MAEEKKTTKKRSKKTVKPVEEVKEPVVEAEVTVDPEKEEKKSGKLVCN